MPTTFGGEPKQKTTSKHSSH
ncbi:hypothetical protein [Staphylococcus aureus]